MSSNITHIKKSIADKEGYMALAHTRLGHRHQRPGTELAQDLVEANLVKEIHELRNVAANLQRMLCEVTSASRFIQNINYKIRTHAHICSTDLINCTQIIIFYHYEICITGRGIATIFAQDANSTRRGYQRQDKYFEN